MGGATAAPSGFLSLLRCKGEVRFIAGSSLQAEKWHAVSMLRAEAFMVGAGAMGAGASSIILVSSALCRLVAEED